MRLGTCYGTLWIYIRYRISYREYDESSKVPTKFQLKCLRCGTFAKLEHFEQCIGLNPEILKQIIKLFYKVQNVLQILKRIRLNV